MIRDLKSLKGLKEYIYQLFLYLPHSLLHTQLRMFLLIFSLLFHLMLNIPYYLLSAHKNIQCAFQNLHTVLYTINYRLNKSRIC